MLPYPTPPLGGGLYVIRLSDTHYYGGRTSDFRERWCEHYRLLRSGRHKNRHMQAVFNKYGVFVPEVLCALSGEGPREPRTEPSPDRYSPHTRAHRGHCSETPWAQARPRSRSKACRVSPGPEEHPRHPSAHERECEASGASTADLARWCDTRPYLLAAAWARVGQRRTGEPTPVPRGG